MKHFLNLYTGSGVKDQEALAIKETQSIARHLVNVMVNFLAVKPQIENFDTELFEKIYERQRLYAKFRDLEAKLWWVGYSGVALVSPNPTHLQSKFEVLIPNYVPFCKLDERQNVEEVVFEVSRKQLATTGMWLHQFYHYKKENGKIIALIEFKQINGDTSKDLNLATYNGLMEKSGLAGLKGRVLSTTLDDINEIPFVSFKNDVHGYNIQDLLGGLLERYKDTAHKYFIDLWQGGNQLFIDTTGTQGTGNQKRERLEREVITKVPIKTLEGGFQSDSLRSVMEFISNNPYGEVYNTQLTSILNQMKKILQIPDFNSGDKGTAQIQSTEVSANLASKSKALVARAQYRELSYTRLFRLIAKIIGIPYNNVKVKIEVDKALKTPINGGLQTQNEKNKERLINETEQTDKVGGENENKV